MSEVVASFEVAADLLVSVVERVPDDAWERPGLGTWSIRELVAHAHRGLTTIEEYLTHPVEPVADPEAYAAPEAVSARGRAAVVALGSDPADAVRRTRARVVPPIAAAPLDSLVGTPFGQRTLESYLPSRTAELTIHSVDIADALGLDIELPDAAARETLRFVGDHAVRRGRGLEVLRALTGRGHLADGFNVY